MSTDTIRLEKVGNLVRLALRLAGSAEGLTLDEIAAEFSISRRSAERMRNTVRDLFPGFGQVEDAPFLRFFIRGGLASFITTPTPVELAELEAQICTLSQGGHHARAELLQALASKIKAALKDPQKRRIATDLEALCRAEAVARQVGPRSSSDARTLEILREALLSMKKVRFAYGPQTGEQRRLVAPYGLLFGRNAYLVGRQKRQSSPVLWRLDRINHLELTDELAQVPEDFDLDVYASRSFGTFQEEPEDVVLRFQPSAAAEARRMVFHPTQHLYDLGDGTLEVRFTAGGLLEVVHHLFSWGDTVQIIAPDRLKTMMVQELERALAQHRQIAGGSYSGTTG